MAHHCIIQPVAPCMCSRCVEDRDCGVSDAEAKRVREILANICPFADSVIIYLL